MLIAIIIVLSLNDQSKKNGTHYSILFHADIINKAVLYKCIMLIPFKRPEPTLYCSAYLYLAFTSIESLK